MGKQREIILNNESGKTLKRFTKSKDAAIYLDCSITKIRNRVLTGEPITHGLFVKYGDILIRTQKYTHNSFIKFLEDNYSNKYSFEKTKFINRYDEVIITCKKHKLDFKILPKKLLFGKIVKKSVGSCPMCYDEHLETIKQNTLNKLPNIYTYKNYINNCTPFYGVCNIHGDFEIKKYKTNIKCPECYPVANDNPKTYTLNNFRYYICDLHGDVEITKNRKTESGCPICKQIDYKKYQLNKREIKKKSIIEKHDDNIKLEFNDSTYTITCKKHSHSIIKKYTSKNSSNIFCPKCRDDIRKLNSKTKIQDMFKDSAFAKIYSVVKYSDDVKYVTLFSNVINREKKYLISGLYLKDISTNPIKILENNGMKHMQFYNAKKVVKNLDITTYKQYKIWHRTLKPKKLPSNPHRVYRNKGFTTYNDFFGTDRFSSKGEQYIEKYLKRNNINFEPQKIFKGCVDKRSLMFDFYIPEKNMLIEFDGPQHYEAVEWFGGEPAFKQQQKRDAIKNEYAQNNNIKLIRITYDKYINNELKDTLNNIFL